MLDNSKSNDTDSKENSSVYYSKPKLFTLKKAETITLTEPTLFKTTLIAQVNNDASHSNKPNEQSSPSLLKKAYTIDSNNNNSPKPSLAKHNSIGLMLLKNIENSMKDELEIEKTNDSETPKKTFEDRNSSPIPPSPSSGLTNFNTANKHTFTYIPPKTTNKSPRNELFNRFNVLGYVKVENESKKQESVVNKQAYQSPNLNNQYKIKREDLKEINLKYGSVDKKSRGHVNKLNDPNMPSVTQSRTFKLLQETLDNGK